MESKEFADSLPHQVNTTQVNIGLPSSTIQRRHTYLNLRLNFTCILKSTQKTGGNSNSDQGCNQFFMQLWKIKTLWISVICTMILS